MRSNLATGIVCVLLAATARAQSFPARTGETGLLDVPDAEVLGPGRGQAGLEFRFDHMPGFRDDFGPLPIYAVSGVTQNLDVGLTMREWGQAGDTRPARVLFGAAAKLRLWPAEGPIPGVALGFVFDRFNHDGVIGSRVALSTGTEHFRVAGFGGAEARTADGFGGLSGTAGIAASLAVLPRMDLVAEALTGPRGGNFGVAARWRLTSVVGVSLAGNYFPRDEAFRVSLGFALAPPPKPRAMPKQAEAQPASPGVAPVTAEARLLENRPHFRLRVPVRGPQQLGAGAHVQHGPTTPRVAAAAGPAKPETPGVRAVAPSLEDLAEAQIKEQEALADARERRVRATTEQLDAREKAALDEAKRLEERERELAGREQQLDARQQRVAQKGPPTQQQRQLESLEGQLASQERNLSAQERSFGPALDAAQGRERDAAAREDAERQEANRLAASVSGASSRALQLEIRKQALGARNRQLAALEARLVAKGERIDALERQLRTKTERLDTWSRRLDTRSERLDLLEKRMSEGRQTTATPKPTETAPQAPKDKAVFVMVVKSPTAIMKERGTAAATPQTGTSLHPGVAVEKAVAAATVVMFPTTASQLSELDREAIDNIAKLAAKDRCELLIWARAKDPGLMAEAQRRAGEIKTRVLAAAPLDPAQVVTRITTRPGAQGVDVVVSALRESAKPAPAPAAAAPQAAALLAGESGRRQIREAVQAAQGSIEACVGEVIVRRNLQRAEGVLKVTVAAEGKVTKVLTGAGDLSGAEMDECLNSASRNWTFPPAEADYVVDVPITVIRGGAK